MTTAFVSHPSFLLHEMGPYHPECPERIGAITDRLIAAGLDAYLQHYTAPAATDEQIAPDSRRPYMQEIEAASPDDGLLLPRPGHRAQSALADAARHAAGAVVLAVDLVMRDECQNAFCAVRPPGHHAERRRAMGFCIFNSVAIGAAHALAAHGLERVAVVDFDVHHGNGTEEIFEGDPRVLMVSTFQHPLYPYCGLDDPAPNMVNVPLAAGSGGEEFRAAVRDRWLPALDEHRPQLILISAGFDAHREDPLAGLQVRRSRLRLGHARIACGGATACARGASCRRWKAATRCPRSAAAPTEHIRALLAV